MLLSEGMREGIKLAKQQGIKIIRRRFVEMNLWDGDTGQAALLGMCPMSCASYLKTGQPFYFGVSMSVLREHYEVRLTETQIEKCMGAYDRAISSSSAELFIQEIERLEAKNVSPKP